MTAPHPPPRSSPWDRRRIVELLIEAGRMAQDLRGRLQPEMKPDRSLVTEADHRIEALFAAEFDRPPASWLIGEETVGTKGEDTIRAALAGTAYVVDPIDGTSPYAHRLHHWGVSIGRMEGGVLTDGAVHLPDYRLMVVSEGRDVLRGDRPEGSDHWSWSRIAPPFRGVPPGAGGPRREGGIIAITQEIAKGGRMTLPNPAQALGAAVVPLVGLLDGRFLAYVGSLRLWDLAGSLPLLDRLGFSITRLHAPPGSRLGLEVGNQGYLLDPDDSFRWGVRGGLLVCPPGEESWIREGFGV